MSTIEYMGTLVCSINVSDLDRSVRWYRDGMAQPNKPANVRR